MMGTETLVSSGFAGRLRTVKSNIGPGETIQVRNAAGDWIDVVDVQPTGNVDAVKVYIGGEPVVVPLRPATN